MKVKFKYKKALGNNKVGTVVEMFEHTAKALRAFGEITKEPLTVLKTEKKSVKKTEDKK